MAMGLVDHQHHRGAALLHAQHLDGGVGVGQRGRLRRGDDDRLVGHRDRVEHHVGDARAGVDQHPVVVRAHRVDQSRELLAHRRRQPRVLDQAGAGQQHLEVAGRGQKRLVERALPGEDIMQRAPGLQVQHHVEVGQTEVGIDHQHPLAPAGQRGGEIGGQHRLADAALAAGDREDTRTLGAAGRGRLGAGRGRQGRRAHRVESSVSGMNADMVLNSMSRSSLLTSEWGGSSMQVRLRPAALAR